MNDSFDDDIRIEDDPCPVCGGEVRSRECTVIGCEDGYIDMHEFDDPLMFDEGDYEVCHECHGVGYLRWCRKCGVDIHLHVDEAAYEQATR